MESDQVSKQLHVDLSVIDEPRSKDPSGLVSWEFTGSSVQRSYKGFISRLLHISGGRGRKHDVYKKSSSRAAESHLTLSD